MTGDGCAPDAGDDSQNAGADGGPRERVGAGEAPGKSAPPGGADAALLERVHANLRAIAQERMKHERAGHTLQATALVHEAWARLQGGGGVTVADRPAFYHAAAEAMRRILIEHARARNAQKRGGGAARVALDVVDLAARAEPAEIEALDAAFLRLEREDPDAARVVRLRFYAGLTVDATAEALGISARQVDRLWAFARAWLARRLEAAGEQRQPEA